MAYPDEWNDVLKERDQLKSENERLQIEKVYFEELAYKWSKQYYKDCDQLRAENERLRCVLQEIAEDNSYREDTDNEVGWHIDNAYEVMNKLKLKSKQALNEVKE